MHLISWNVAGLRAALRKGFGPWFAKCGADVVSLQETKARPDQLPADWLPGCHGFWHGAQKPGYSGVAVLTRREPLSVTYGLGIEEIDVEGRVLTVEFPEFHLVNAYFPHARHDHSRLAYKLSFCEALMARLTDLEARKPVVLCGDYNIAHTDLDLANPRANRDNPGFLPEERAWMDRFLAAGYSDVFRRQRGELNGDYTWWSYRKGVRERNVGWRIDYHCVSKGLLSGVVDVGHDTEVYGSDHCPIYLRLDLGQGRGDQQEAR